MLFFITLIILLLGWYYHTYRERLAISAKLPGPKGLPLIGHAHLFFGKSPPQVLDVLAKAHKEFPKITCFMLGPHAEILISCPKMAEVVLGSQKLIDKSSEYDFIEQWLGTGLLISTGKKWFQRRKVITPAFHFKILDQFIEIFDKHGKTLVENLQKSKGYTIDVFQPIALSALDIICETAMGVEINAQTNSNSKYVQAVKEISGIMSKRIFNVHLRNDFIFKLTSYGRRQEELLKLLHGFTDSVILERREELMRNKNDSMVTDENDDVGAKKKMAFLDILLKSTIDGKPLSNMDIREEVDTFMFEGHDTTTSGIAFCLYNLAKNPKIQQKAFEEVRHVMGDDFSTAVTLKSLNDLHYMEMVIKESLRLYPSVPIFGRKMHENVEINGYIIPKSANIGIAPFFMARDPTLWKDPLKFQPERFDIDKPQMHPYLNVPFSAGPRNCIGQKFAMLEMKSSICKVLRSFELEVGENYEPELVAELILRPINGVMLKIKERKY